MSTTVLICDDDPIVRDALEAYLEGAAEIEIVAAVGTAEEALEAAATLDPHVVLMDLSMPGMGGLAGATAMLREHPGTSVLMLTTFGTHEQVREALAVGATGFLLKSATAATLLAAVRAAASGAGTVITPEIAAALSRDGAPTPAPADGASRAPSAPRPQVPSRAPHPSPSPQSPCPPTADAPSLTDREREVLHLLCQADTNTQIAERLVLSESTVKKHVTSLMMKLGSTSRLQIAVRAFELGLARPPGPTS